MENNLTYTQVGDFLIPNLALPEQPDRDLGKYGRMRRTYLKEHRPGLFNRLTLNGTLFSHLLEIEDTAMMFRQVFFGLSFEQSFLRGLDIQRLARELRFVYSLLKA